ncbi:MAG: protein translocase subunit SecD [Clostridia bacterium]|nr:protein translocase subunit SecD [Clostridia bacterium]
MKSGNKRVGGKTGAIIALCVLLVVTIVLGVIGVTGLSLPPRGLYKVLSWLPTTNSENWPASLPLGLDLRGGMYVEYSGKAPEDTDASFDSLMEGTMSIIRARLTDKGFTEANVQRLGNDGIRVEIPDVQDDSVLDLIGAAAKMRFLDPDGNEFMTGNMVESAGYSLDENGRPAVGFKLTSEGAKIFAEMTSANVGKNLIIELDGVTLVNARVQHAIVDGSGIITGNYTDEEAVNIAAKIQSGALPLELTQQKVDKVSATLGQDAVSTSVKAAMIGILLIMLLMIIRYRLNGFIASWALTIYTILLFMLIAIFHIQLTLPGLAGVVLGIGMAVDANVIIFERFNEEVRKGRSAKAAVRAGFKNAMSAILDANVTTLIAAVVLLFFGTGSIQGFAKTLLLGVIVSMFTAIMVTRFLMNRFVNAGATKTSLYTRVANTEKEVEE